MSSTDRCAAVALNVDVAAVLPGSVEDVQVGALPVGRRTAVGNGPNVRRQLWLHGRVFPLPHRIFAVFAAVVRVAVALHAVVAAPETVSSLLLPLYLCC